MISKDKNTVHIFLRIMTQWRLEEYEINIDSQIADSTLWWLDNGGHSPV